MKIDKNCFVADGVKIVGDVEIKKDSSVWFNAVIRGDFEKVVVGEGTNIQDLVTIHSDIDLPTIIGDNVTVGHNAVIHGAIIEDYALIGIGAIVLNGAIVEEGALVAAGCLVPPGKVVPKNHLAIGNPMKIVKKLTEADSLAIRKNCEMYIKLSKGY